MKKKIALILAVIFSLGALTLTACTDKEQPRELDSVEQSIVGTWQYDDFAIQFRSDGTWTATSYVKTRQFKHIGNGMHGELGHYEIIDCEIDKYALFDIYPDRLYPIHSDGTVSNNYLMQ